MVIGKWTLAALAWLIPLAAAAQSSDMVLVTGTEGDFCIDRYEAPGEHGALPLVMYAFTEAEAWCMARGKRLCLDTEWTQACAGPDGWTYPYGNTRVPGQCNDDATFIPPNSIALTGWPLSVSTSSVSDLATLLDAARAVSSAGTAAADEVERLYQGEGAGSSTACTSHWGAVDLVGNAREWTRRADGGADQFHGSLKGGYWAASSSCQTGLTSHSDGFRNYEGGFRCCAGVERCSPPVPATSPHGLLVLAGLVAAFGVLSILPREVARP